MVYRQTDRERQRYVTYEGPDPCPTFRALYGAMGGAQAGLQRQGPGVLRTTAGSVHNVRAAIALTLGCRSVRVGTSIRDAKDLASSNKTLAASAVSTKTKPHNRARGTV